jgi:hypothetical protein
VTRTLPPFALALLERSIVKMVLSREGVWFPVRAIVQRGLKGPDPKNAVALWIRKLFDVHTVNPRSMNDWDLHIHMGTYPQDYVQRSVT